MDHIRLFSLKDGTTQKDSRFHIRYNLILKFCYICSNIRAYNPCNVVINKGNQVFIFIDNAMDKIGI